MKRLLFPVPFFSLPVLLVFLTGLPGVAGGLQGATPVAVGVAKLDITPSQPQLLAGYGSRTIESEGVDESIWARALALGERDPVVVVAVDNCGVPRSVVEKVARRLAIQTRLNPERLVVCSTHTHNAPTLTGYATVLWGGRATAGQLKRADDYTAWLTGKLVEVVRSALSERQPCHLSWGQGRVRFGGNRRVLKDGRWAGFGFQKDGPVDHSMPLLVAKNEAGTPVALWANYACHCTTVGARNRVGGDWAGYANASMEQDHPGSVSLTTIGCGADVGPQRTGTLELARQHGREMADEVKRLLETDLTPLHRPPSVLTRRVQLPFDALPDRAHFETRKGGFEEYHAGLQLARLERDGRLPAHLDYPITTWTFGKDLAIVFLAGEVVVDYAVRLKQELDWSRVWINGWANDVPCYIPSKRVLKEGGYEPDFSMIYYDQPTRFAPEVEDVIVNAVRGMLGRRFRPTKETGDSPFHRHPVLDGATIDPPPNPSK